MFSCIDLPEAKKVLVTKSRGSERVMVAKMCEDLVLEIYERKEAWPFLTPVSRRDVSMRWGGGGGDFVRVFFVCVVRSPFW